MSASQALVVYMSASAKANRIFTDYKFGHATEAATQAATAAEAKAYAALVDAIAVLEHSADRP